jgi:hypothetical protein
MLDACCSGTPGFQRCCHDMDCHRADEVGRRPENTLVLSRGNIRMRVPRSFPIEVSPNSKSHFCVR